ncbi:iron-sulfur cluster biosynthesis protein [Lentzea sp. NBRC 105346]|uniref:iron-sulfur cluster biosynthesis protein n=1 Tax=Lentzea sp. NBRC 105346 TaxID=3032205 RepID=UPI0024A18F4A|nr:iron-sulfur cluster biosynthesis protein [Lentzea sp. NBRC 105346]GLZ31677.1 iron-sulfur cluster biosynthesis protein [Lentzea sp. NBRC 105346]
MLEVTPVAAEVIKELVSEAPKSETPDAGLKFSLRGEENSQAALELSVAEPADGDEVIAAESGAKVIMEPAAARYLDDKVLDIREDANGQPAFAIARQA